MSEERLLTDTIRVQTVEINRLKERLSEAEATLKEIISLSLEPVSRRPIQLAYEYLAKWGLTRNY